MVSLVRRSRPVRARFVLFVALAIHLGQASSAASLFSVDPTESWISVAGTSIDFDFGSGAHFVTPLTSQLGALPGVSAGSGVPGPGPNDGLSAALGGSLLVDEVFCSFGPDCLRVIQRASTVDVLPSGLWLPGAPLNTSTPSAAALAAVFSGANGAFSGALAIRDLQLIPRLFDGLGPAVGGVRSTSLGTQVFFGGSTLEMDLPFGVFSAGLPRDTRLRSATPVTIEVLPDGNRRLVMGIDITKHFDVLDLNLGLPIEIDLRLLGSIVAYERPINVPEAGLGMMLCSALVFLAARGQARRTR